MKSNRQLILAGALSLVLLSGCQGAVPVVPTQDGSVAPAPATPPAAEQPAPATPVATPGSLTGKAAIFSQPLADAEVQALPVGLNPATGKYVVLATSAIARGQTNGEGAFSLDMPNTVPAGTPLKLVVTKDGVAVATLVLSGQTGTGTKVNQATTLALLLTKMDQLTRTLRDGQGELVSPEAAGAMVEAFQSLANAAETALPDDEQGRSAVNQATTLALVVDGQEMPLNLKDAFAKSASTLQTAFATALAKLSDAVNNARAAGGTAIGSTTLSFGNASGTISRSSSHDNTPTAPTEIAPVAVEATGTFELPGAL